MSFQREAKFLSGSQTVFSPNCSWEVAEVGKKRQGGAGFPPLLGNPYSENIW